MESEQLQKVIDGLFEMAWSDGSVSSVEKSTINKILLRLGLRISEVMKEMGQRLDAPPGEVDLLEVIPDRETRLEVLKFFIAVCFCDDHLDPGELAIIERLAVQFEIGADELDRLRVSALEMLNLQEGQSDTGSLTAVEKKSKAASPRSISLGE